MSTYNFAEACATYRILRERGYPEKATLKLVGDRHRLSRIQRNCMFRGVIVGGNCRASQSQARGGGGSIRAASGSRLVQRPHHGRELSQGRDPVPLGRRRGPRRIGHSRQLPHGRPLTPRRDAGDHATIAAPHPLAGRRVPGSARSLSRRGWRRSCAAAAGASSPARRGGSRAERGLPVEGIRGNRGLVRFRACWTSARGSLDLARSGAGGTVRFHSAGCPRPVPRISRRTAAIARERKPRPASRRMAALRRQLPRRAAGRLCTSSS